MHSELDVQQSDPLGPLLFSSTLWPLLLKIGELVPNLTQDSWFLDDGTLAWSEQRLNQFLQILLNDEQEQALFSRKDKRKILSNKRRTIY